MMVSRWNTNDACSTNLSNPEASAVPRAWLRRLISYSRPDAKAAEELARLLRGAGFKVWLDIWELAVGARLAGTRLKAIRSRSAVIICLGQSGTSQWQRGEYRTAVQFEAIAGRSKPLIPVLLPGADPATLPTEFKTRVWVDLSSRP